MSESVVWPRLLLSCWKDSNDGPRVTTIVLRGSIRCVRAVNTLCNDKENTYSTGQCSIEAFIRRGVPLGFYGAGDPTAQQLAADCSGEWEVQWAPRASPPNSQTSPATARASSLDDITLYSQQKLMIGILSLDNYSTTFIDTVYCFIVPFYIVSSHILIDCIIIIIIITIFFNDKLSDATHYRNENQEYKYNSIGLTVNEWKLK